MPPYRVFYSDLFRAQIKGLPSRVDLRLRLPEIVGALRSMHQRLQWIPLDFGEPLRDLVHLGLTECIATQPPLVIKFGVDESRRIVYVALPFDLLPHSGF
jgi:hypothetical protein